MRQQAASPLRIAVVAACPFPTLQGSQVLISQHAQAMAARGHSVHIVAYHLGLSFPLSSQERGLGGEVHRIPPIPLYTRLRAGPSVGKPLLDLLLALKLLAVALRERIDVFHAHNVEGVLAAWPIARLLRKPLVFHTHTLMEGELPTYFANALVRRAMRHVGRWLDALLPRLADRCVVLSPEASAAFARLGAKSDRLVVIPPGVEDRFSTPTVSQASALRARYHLGDGPLAIYTGNLDPYQGLDDLLRAFARTRRVLPNAQLVVASHATPTALLDLSGEGVRYIHVRSFEEAAGLLGLSDVAVCPRPACLGYPIKLLNYMTAGKAIACAAGSARGIVHLDNGYVYRDGDVEALAEALIRLLTDRPLAQRMGYNARRHVRRMRWGALAASFEALYRDLLRSGQAIPTNVMREARSQ
jgi:glycosyltransferase involved in cell wall biosynthesis